VYDERDNMPANAGTNHSPHSCAFYIFSFVLLPTVSSRIQEFMLVIL